MKKFTADFETTTKEDDARVWAWGLCEIGNTENFIHGTDFDELVEFAKNKRENYVFYYHNLKFDGEYWFNYLLNNGFEYVKTKKERKCNTFTCLISDTGQFYSIEIYFDLTNKRKPNKLTLYDSLKILNFSVDFIASEKGFNLPNKKGEIDYHKDRPLGYIPDDEEIEYLRNDVVIMALALEIMFEKNLTKMTIGSNALANYKEINRNFNKYFPTLEHDIDQDIRRSYKGGFTYLSPLYKAKEVGTGIVIDVNSLYPSVMSSEILPFGEPVFFDGKYKEDRLYPLYVQQLTCEFKIKEGKIPSIQLKNNLAFIPNEYLETSNGEIVTLTLTNVDLDLFLEQYDVEHLEYHAGWKFKAIKGLFSEYIEYWTEIKKDSKKNENNALYLISKLMLNSLYGKFGLNPNVRSKYPFLNDDGIVKYGLHPREVRDSIYLPVASFITSYARLKTISTSQKIRDYSTLKYNEDCYIYSDTDSIHMKKITKEELEVLVDIDKYKLGAWSIDAEFRRAKFLRQKCYLEDVKIGDDKYKLIPTIAGMPKRLSDRINFNNFDFGFTTSGKLTFKHVKGGVLLVDTDFTIKK